MEERMVRTVRAVVVMATAALLVAACGGNSQPVASASPSPSSNAGHTVTVELYEYRLEVSQNSVTSGKYTFKADNEGKLKHNLVVADTTGKILGQTALLSPGADSSLDLTLAPGTYMLYCGVPGHRSAGMNDTLTVK
jgi:plastocyanin